MTPPGGTESDPKIRVPPGSVPPVALGDSSQPATRHDSQHELEETEAASLELTRWEADALERFAPVVGATPRRLTRFVNVYRLIKTSLPPRVLERFVGTEGESETYRALVAQLALVTGAPEASQEYFLALERAAEDDTLSGVIKTLADVPAFQDRAEFGLVQRILALAEDGAYGRKLKVGQLRLTAPIVRRYSFTARPH